MYHTEVVRDGNREYEERSSSVVSGKCGSDIHKNAGYCGTAGSIHTGRAVADSR